MARDALHDKERFQVVGGFLSPVSDEYQKTGLAPAADRIAMCRLAIRDSDWVEVDDYESKQPLYMRTIEVLDALQERVDAIATGAKVMLLAGADLIKSFEMPGLWAVEDVFCCLYDPN
jgi:nicotinate (nicotinamide) nucleotide adenylyltransferase